MKKTFLVLLMLQAFISNAQKESGVINTALKTELELILKEDQEGRLMIDSIGKKFGLESMELLSLYERIALKDSLNQQRVMAIIDQYGWPGKPLVGKDGNMAVFLVIQHAPLDLQKKYLPQFRESVAKGESSATSLAYLEDRILMREGKPQRYGTQVITDNNGQNKFYEIEDEVNVDERRLKIGLISLAEYAKRFGIDYKKPTK
jgi:hypothetical protein